MSIKSTIVTVTGTPILMFTNQPNKALPNYIYTYLQVAWPVVGHQLISPDLTNVAIKLCPLLNYIWFVVTFQHSGLLSPFYSFFSLFCQNLSSCISNWATTKLCTFFGLLSPFRPPKQERFNSRVNNLINYIL